LSLGVSIFLLVVGAILTFAVDLTTSGFNLNTVGVILMVAGALGLVLSLLFWSSFAPYRREPERGRPRRYGGRGAAHRAGSPLAPVRTAEIGARGGLSARAAGRRRLGAPVGPVWSPPTRALIHASMRSP
jgi:Domain of unknown function (DUF6458)